MCWSVPGKITGINGTTAEIEISGAVKRVKLDLVDDVAVGEYVLVHAGYVIQKVDEERAKFTIDFFNEARRDAEISR